MASTSVSCRCCERYFAGDTAHGWRCNVELGSFWRIRSRAARSVPGIPPSHDNHRQTVLGAKPTGCRSWVGLRSSYMMGIPLSSTVLR